MASLLTTCEEVLDQLEMGSTPFSAGRMVELVGSSVFPIPMVASIILRAARQLLYIAQEDISVEDALFRYSFRRSRSHVNSKV